MVQYAAPQQSSGLLDAVPALASFLSILLPCIPPYAGPQIRVTNFLFTARLKSWLQQSQSNFDSFLVELNG